MGGIKLISQSQVSTFPFCARMNFQLSPPAPVAFGRNAGDNSFSIRVRAKKADTDLLEQRGFFMSPKGLDSARNSLPLRAKLRPRLEILEDRWLPTGNIHTIQHVIVIMQENRSFDSYFGTYPGADGIPMQNGVPITGVPDPVTGQLVYPSLTTTDHPVNGPHGFADAAQDINGGQMNGFLHSLRPGDQPGELNYWDATSIPNYWAYAQHFALQDHLFSGALGWSLPAHLDLVSNWVASCSDPLNPMSCASDPALTSGFNQTGDPNQELYAWTDLTYLLQKHGVSWGYYLTQNAPPADPEDGSTPQIWNPLPHFTDVHQDNQLSSVQDSSNFFTQAASGTLPNVSWVLPSPENSEHPGFSVRQGQAWVTSVVNAVMSSPDWASSAIFVTWDEWGGFYDHVVPPVLDGEGLGIRVPGLVISPWVKAGSIDSQVLSFDNYNKFIEDDFLGGQALDPATDGRPDSRPGVREDSPLLGDLSADFDFNQTPLPALILPLHPDSPTALAGGPYVISQGQSLTLNASGSTSPNAGPLTFGWDLTHQYLYQDASGATPTISWASLVALGIDDPGQSYPIQVEVTDSLDYSTISEATTLTIMPVAPTVLLAGEASVLEQAPFTLNLTPGILGDGDSYAISWGDGNTTTTAGLPAQVSHTYALAGTYAIAATISAQGTAYPANNSLTLTVNDAAIVGSPVTFTPAEGELFSGLVGTFVDSGSNGSPNEYSVIIGWGDGQQTSGTVVSAGGNNFRIIGAHTYARAGTFNIFVTIADVGGSHGGINNSITVVPAVLQADPVLPSPIEGAAFSGGLATFTDPLGVLRDFSTTIAWGDGNTSAGTITSTGNGQYAIAGANLYAEEGSYVATVTLSKDSVVAGSIGISLAIADAPLQATTQSISATEGTAFSGVVAAFRDPGSDGTTSDYSATIVWGDGNQSSGTIVATGSGSFTVSGSNVYAKAGSFSALVEIYDKGGASASVTTQAVIQDAPLEASPESITPTAGTAFTGIVAEFRDPGADGDLGEYSATIAWGDGNTSAGTVAGSASAGFTVTGTNTYASAGRFNVVVTIDDVGGATATVDSSATVSAIALTAAAPGIAPTEGILFSGTVATFTNQTAGTSPANYTANIIWGDGQSLAGTITATSSTTFSVSGANNYAEEGSYSYSVLITFGSGAGAVSVTAYGTATVGDAVLTGTAKVFQPVEAKSGMFTVAAFTDGNAGAAASDFSATINWGDGNQSPGTVTTNMVGGFNVTGTNTYSRFGVYPVSVTIDDVGGANVTVQSEANVSDAPLRLRLKGFTALEETPFSGVVALFTDPDPNGIAGDYTAAINWGDSTTSAASISVDPAGGFDVVGNHTYSANGNYSITVTVNDAGGATTSRTGGTTVLDVRLLREPPSQSFFGQVGALVIARATEGVSFAGEVATFTDPGANGTTNLYQVSINWGDGPSATPGTVVADPSGNNLYDVLGTHTYASTGTYYTVATVLDPGPSSPPNKVPYFGAAQVAPAPLALIRVALTPVEGIAWAGPVAKFTTANPGAVSSNYTATISWGDGTSSAVTVSENSTGVFSVSGTHTYAEEGNYPLGITIDEHGYFLSALQSNAAVSDAPLSASGNPLQAAPAVSFSGAIATFTDPGGALPAGSYKAMVSWGDGTNVAAATIVFSNGVYIVSGTHIFATPGKFTVNVTISDPGGSQSLTSALATIGDQNQRFVAQLYLDLLHRPVDSSGLGNWTGAIAAGDSRSSVAMQIESSPEYLTDIVSGYYQFFLHRAPDSGGLAADVAYLQAGHTEQQLETIFTGSAEYFSVRGGGTNAGFLNALYLDALNRPPDPSGLAHWEQLLNQGQSRAQVAAAIFASQEYDQDVVETEYLQFLHRPADTTGLAAFVNELEQGATIQSVIATIVGSNEYFGRV
jgi:phospholipase C